MILYSVILYFFCSISSAQTSHVEADWVERAYKQNPGIQEIIENDQDAQRVLKEAVAGNLLRAITTLPSHKEHLINPILLVLREYENLNDNSLFQLKSDYYNYHELARSEGINWGHSGSSTSYNNLQDFLNRADSLYVSHLPSLRALPLFKGKKLKVTYGLYDDSTRKPMCRVLNQSNYADVVRLLDLNQLTSFELLPNYNHEADNIVTIQSFAQAIARQKVLEDFVLPRYIGVANFQQLLMNGIVPNQSIKSLSYKKIYGDMPVALMGKMLAKNKVITSLNMFCESLRDLECLNEFGRGLEKNTTLQQLTLKIYSIASSNENDPNYIKPLWGRDSNTYSVNLDPFKKALILYKGKLTLGNNSRSENITPLFNAVNLEGEQEKLKIQQRERELEQAKQYEDAQLTTAFEEYRKKQNPIDSFMSLIEQETKATNFRIADKNTQIENDLFGIDFFRPLSFSMLSNSHITILQIVNFHLGDDEIVLLSEMLKRNKILRSVEFQQNIIGDKGAIALGKALGFNPGLRNLQLKQNQISDDGAIALAQGLRNNSTLQTFDISDNKIKDDGAVVLGQVLKVNTTLQTLNLSANQIQDDGAIAIGQSLKANPVLTTLDISSNQIGNDGAVGIGQGLKLNSTLKILNLANNKIKNDGAMGIKQGMRLNEMLELLNLNGNQIDSEEVTLLKETLGIEGPEINLNFVKTERGWKLN